MSKHHEFCTATALRVLTVWHQEGIGTMGYNPATNFAGEANKFINNHASGSGKMLDAQGNYYYVSHPPLAYYLPYAVFSVLHIEPDVLPLQYFNLFVNLICGFGIYLLARRLLPNYVWSGLLAALVYWFTPAVLWFQSNVYMSDMMVQPFFIVALLLALYVAESPKPLAMVGLALVCFLGTYITWFGVFIAFSLGVYFLYRSINKPVYLMIVGLLAVSQVAALALMAWQYSQIADWEAYLAELSHRFNLRSSAPTHWWPLLSSLGINYFVNYGAILVFVPVLFMIKRPYGSNMFAFLGLLPILLMHVLLVNYTGHDFTTLYLAVPLSVFVGMLAGSQNRLLNWQLWAVMAVFMVSGFMFYQYVNPYGQYSYNGDRYDTNLVEAEALTKAPTDALLFSIGKNPSPEALWYAKRNVKVVANEEEAMQFLQERGIETGVIYKHLFGAEFEKTKTIYLQSNQ